MSDKNKQMPETKKLGVDLSGQVAVVTGASQGLGRSIAETLAANGAVVALVARNAEKLSGVASAIQEAGGQAEVFPCDVTKPESIGEVIESIVEKLGRLDILVNNAGITRDTLLPRMSDQEWEDVLATNLRAPFLFMRAASRPMMSQRYGRMINVSSVSGLIGNAGQANYSGSKAGLVGLTRTVAKELAGRKVTVNAVAPGFIASDMTAPVKEKYDRLITEGLSPIRRWGTGEDVATAVRILSSGELSFSTGERLNVDGGFHIRRL